MDALGNLAYYVNNGPYSKLVEDTKLSKSREIRGTYNTMKCKCCGKSTFKTLLKDGDGYICRECKTERGE